MCQEPCLPSSVLIVVQRCLTGVLQGPSRQASSYLRQGNYDKIEGLQCRHRCLEQSLSLGRGSRM